MPVSIEVNSSSKVEVIDLTRRVEKALEEFDSVTGINLWVPHTTAAITVNEAADPDVMRDFIDQINRQIPFDNDYRHFEGNSAAHIKSILVGSHQWVPVEGNRLALGRWQGIFFLELDGPRRRTVKLYPA